MERVRLFGPIDTDLLVQYYARCMANLEPKPEDRDPADEKLVLQLYLALEHRQIDTSKINPSYLDGAKMAQLKASMLSCYRSSAPKLSPDELGQYYVRLIINDLDDFARPIYDELVRRGLPVMDRRILKTVQQDFAQSADAHNHVSDLCESSTALADFWASKSSTGRCKNTDTNGRHWRWWYC